METLCFNGYYAKRFARSKEFCNQKLEAVFDRQLKSFCDSYLKEEFSVLIGAERYERTEDRTDYSGGHYTRRLVTGRGILDLKVPRGAKRTYSYSFFKKYKRHSELFEELVIQSVLLGHSTRKARSFFGRLLGEDGISHQFASKVLSRFDEELKVWRKRPIRDHAVTLVLDAVYLKGSSGPGRQARPVLCAWAVWEDGHEELIAFEAAGSESMKSWSGILQTVYARGLKNVRLIVSDEHAAIRQCALMFWPEALSQSCVFHVMQNLAKSLKGKKNKRKILDAASELYEAPNEQEFKKRSQGFCRKFKKYLKDPGIRNFISSWKETTRFYELPAKFWPAAKTSNRLERLFEEVKRRTRAFRRFPNALSCERWMYALVVHLYQNAGY